MFHKIPDAGIFFKISLDVVRRLSPGNAELPGQTKGGDPINNTKINGFGLTSNHWVHALNGHSKYLGCGQGMDIHAVMESPF